MNVTHAASPAAGLTDVIQTQQTVMVKVGEDVDLSCQLMQTKDVLQVTWQKDLPEGKRNIASYNKYFGQTVNDGFKGKLEFKHAGLENCAIVIRKVTEQDEGCYLCLFNMYPDGSLTGRTCLHLYELHEPILQIRESNSSEETVVSCSATGRPAPAVTLNVLQQDLYFSNSSTVSVTNTNATVTVTTTAVLSGFRGNGAQVGCAVQLFSVPEIQVFKTIPAVKQPPGDGLTDVIQTQQTVMVKVGEDVDLSCQLMQTKDVLQVTWQKDLPEGKRNIASYNKYFGQTVNDGFKGKLEFKHAGLKNCSIVIRKVTEQDEGCYLCLFNMYPDGSLTGRTCLHLYELHEPILQIRESNSGEETVVSCSATGRPAPTVTLNVPQQDLYFSNSSTVSVTNTNATVTVTTTAVLSGFRGNGAQVGCAVRLISVPEIQVFKTIPAVKQPPGDGEKHFRNHQHGA
ncbi:butyrophilin-like protein 2 [Scomber japonicus]|uniref:butyrophilin-like protein 2 n=1 Tax=Scomber japonicus TaxID=13676 RepID=UPI0023060E12|nr:butyrophilin-like protein 2 [Scomber japonicus]